MSEVYTDNNNTNEQSEKLARKEMIFGVHEVPVNIFLNNFKYLDEWQIENAGYWDPEQSEFLFLTIYFRTKII
jgi:hypothetical protein